VSAAVFGSPVKRRSCWGAVTVVTGFAVGYSAVVRPRLLRWGASDEEVHGSYPGAEPIPAAGV
jgi:hypothetical protein